jgi:hypothetical protein
MRSLVLVFSISLLFLSGFAIAGDGAGKKMRSLELLQNLVNNPLEAREMRRKIKNGSKKELAEFNSLNEVIKKEIHNISSSLPSKIDKYTTMDSASISEKNIAFKHTLSNDMVGIEYKNEVMAEMNKMLKKGFCSSPSGAYLILGYTWSYFYFREDGTYYGGVIIDAKTCNFE